MNTPNKTIINKRFPSTPKGYNPKSLDLPNSLLRKNHVDTQSNFLKFDFFFKKLTNLIMRDGKKAKALKIIFKMLIIIKNRIKGDFRRNQGEFSRNYTLLHVISRALENLTPSLEVRKVRIAGSTYLVPAVLSKKKQETLALKWVLESAKKRQKNSKLDFSTCLADEILDASRKLGQARQKRDELHRLAQINRAYIRYRWW